jgi:hypothetical protein
MLANCLSNISEALKNGGFELITQRRTLPASRSSVKRLPQPHAKEVLAYPQVVKQMVHEGITVRVRQLPQGPGNVADQTNGHRAEARVVLAAEGIIEEGRKCFHVWSKVPLERTCESADSCEYCLRDARLASNRVQDLKKHAHDPISLRLDFMLQTLDDGLHEKRL